MIDWIIAVIPWWVWAIVAIVVLGALHRLVGWKGIIAGALAFGALFAFKRGQAIGENRVLRKANKDADKAIERARKVRADADARNAEPERLRQSDGFRRD